MAWGFLNSVGAGLSEAGQSVAKFAGDAAMQEQKAELDRQAISLSSQLQQQREHAARVETGQTTEAQIKRVGAVNAWTQSDAFLKAAGYPGGLEDIGVHLKDVVNPDGTDKTPSIPGATGTSSPPTPAPAATAPAPASSAPDGAPAPVTGDATASSAAPPTPSAPTGDAITATKVQPGQGAKPPVVLGQNGRPIGIALPPGYTAQMALIGGPEGLSKAWGEWAKPQIMRPGTSWKYLDMASGQVKTLAFQPELPPGTAQAEDGSVVTLQGATQAIQSSAQAQALGRSQGELPAEKEKIAAQGEQTRLSEAYATGLHAATDLVQQYDEQRGQYVYTSRAKALAGLNQDLGLPAPPPIGRPPAGGKAAATAPVGAQSDASFVLPDKLTVIPPAPAQAPQRGGVAAQPSAVDAADQKTYEKMVTEWNDAVPSAAQAEQRFTEMANVFKTFNSGAWATTKAEIGRQLIAMGVDKKAVSDMMNGSPADFQELVKQNFSAALNSLSASRLGRITQNEIILSSQNMPNVNLEPEANAKLIGQGIGIARWQEAFAAGWNAAKRMGYDPLDYQSAFVKANPVQKYVDAAVKEIGPLKGGEPTTQMTRPITSGQYKGQNAVSTDGGKTWQLQQ